MQLILQSLVAELEKPQKLLDDGAPRVQSVEEAAFDFAFASAQSENEEATVYPSTLGSTQMPTSELGEVASEEDLEREFTDTLQSANLTRTPRSLDEAAATGRETGDSRLSRSPFLFAVDTSESEPRIEGQRTTQERPRVSALPTSKPEVSETSAVSGGQEPEPRLDELRQPQIQSDDTRQPNSALAETQFDDQADSNAVIGLTTKEPPADIPLVDRKTQEYPKEAPIQGLPMPSTERFTPSSDAVPATQKPFGDRPAETLDVGSEPLPASEKPRKDSTTSSTTVVGMDHLQKRQNNTRNSGAVDDDALVRSKDVPKGDSDRQPPNLTSLTLASAPTALSVANTLSSDLSRSSVSKSGIVLVSDVAAGHHHLAPLQPSSGVDDILRSSVVESSRPEPAAARSMVNQIVQIVLRTQNDKVVEIRLQPEELGRVRLSMSASEVGISIQVTAERFETLELLRRNVDLLAADLRDRGFDNPSFTFGSETASQDFESSADGSRRNGESEHEGAQHKLKVDLVPSSLAEQNGRLDIRV